MRWSESPVSHKMIRNTIEERWKEICASDGLECEENMVCQECQCDMKGKYGMLVEDAAAAFEQGKPGGGW